jgi:hypothetical protein
MGQTETTNNETKANGLKPLPIVIQFSSANSIFRYGQTLGLPSRMKIQALLPAAMAAAAPQDPGDLRQEWPILFQHQSPPSLRSAAPRYCVAHRWSGQF